MSLEDPRERLIAAMRESVIEKGFRETTVADVVRIARTSRRTFYEHFSDREACFLALFEETTRQTMQSIAAAVHPDSPWDDQIDQALDAYIEAVTIQPELQQSFVRELPGLGRMGSELQRQVTEGFARTLMALVESGRREQPEVMARELPRDVAIMIVGGLRELLVVSIQEGRDLHELRASSGQVVQAIMRSVVL